MCDGAVYPSVTGLSTLAGTSWQRTQVGSCVLTHAKPNSGAGGLQGPPGLLLASLQVWLPRPAPACFAGAKNYTLVYLKSLWDWSHDASAVNSSVGSHTG